MIVLESPVKSMTSQLEKFSLEDCKQTEAVHPSNDDGRETISAADEDNHQCAGKISPLKRDRPVTRNSKNIPRKDEATSSRLVAKTENEKVLVSPKKKTKQNFEVESETRTSTQGQISSTNQNSPNQNSETASANQRQTSDPSLLAKRSLKFDVLKSHENEKETKGTHLEGMAVEKSAAESNPTISEEATEKDSTSKEEKQKSVVTNCSDSFEKTMNIENKLHQKVKKPKSRRSKSVDLFGNQVDLSSESTDTKLTQNNRQPVTKARKGRKQKSIDDLSIAANSKVTDFYQYRRSDRRLGGKVWTKEDIYEKLVKQNCQHGLKIVEFEGKGRGIVATKTFERNDFVVEYKGDLISPQEARMREEQFENDPNVGCYMYYFVHGGIRYCIDATKELEKYGYGRLLNHSRKQANCRTKSITVEGQPKLILIANRSIEEGEELLYDYGDRSKTALNNHPWLAL